jgi:hypothetical protein
MQDQNTEPSPKQTATNKSNQETAQHPTSKLLSPKAGILNQAIRRPHRDSLGSRGDVIVTALFSFPEEFAVFHFCDVFEASFYQLGCFLQGLCGFADVVVAKFTRALVACIRSVFVMLLWPRSCMSARVVAGCNTHVHHVYRAVALDVGVRVLKGFSRSSEEAAGNVARAVRR